MPAIKFSLFGRVKSQGWPLKSQGWPLKSQGWPLKSQAPLEASPSCFQGKAKPRHPLTDPGAFCGVSCLALLVRDILVPDTLDEPWPSERPFSAFKSHYTPPAPESIGPLPFVKLFRFFPPLPGKVEGGTFGFFGKLFHVFRG